MTSKSHWKPHVRRGYGADVAVLTCRHTLDFTVHVPEKGDEVWCRQCQTMRAVKYVPNRKDLRVVRCRDCRYARNFGLARLTAEQAWMKHSMKRRHRVLLLDGNGKLLHEANKENTKLAYTEVELPFDQPPF